MKKGVNFMKSFSVSGERGSVSIFCALLLSVIVFSGCEETIVDTVPDTINSTKTFRNGQEGYYGCEDTFVHEAHPATNYSDGTLIHINSGSGTSAYGYLRFDLSYFPSGTKITSANLMLFFSSAAVQSIETSRVLDSFDISTVNYDTRPTSGSVTIADKTDEYRVNLPAAMIQEWVNNPDINNGLEVKMHNSNEVTEAYSSEYATDASYRPMLEINYEE